MRMFHAAYYENEDPYYFAPRDGRSGVSVCLWVCLSVRTSQKPHVRTSRNFLYMFPVAVAQSSSDDNAICYVLPVSWMTSYFLSMWQMQIQAIGELFAVTRELAPLNFVPGDEVCYHRLHCSPD